MGWLFSIVCFADLIRFINDLPKHCAATRLSKLLPTRLKSAAALIESRLHRHHPELTILDFTMRGHQPHEVDRMAGYRNVRMKALRHDHGVSVAHYTDELRLVRICVDKLNTERRCWHVVIDVKLFQNRCVFVRRPTGPVARLGSGKAREYASSLDVLAERNVDGAGIRRATGFAFKLAV